MVQGTTPEHTFTLPFDTSLIVEARVSYGQRDKQLVVKKETDCTMSGNILECSLTQEETLKFEKNRPLQIQLKVKTVDGKVNSTDIIERRVIEALYKEVL